MVIHVWKTFLVRFCKLPNISGHLGIKKKISDRSYQDMIKKTLFIFFFAKKLQLLSLFFILLRVSTREHFSPWLLN